MFDWLRRARAEVDWTLKGLLPLSLPVRLKGAHRWDVSQGAFGPRERERFEALRSRFDLDPWPRILDEAGLGWNLVILDLLDQTLDQAQTPPGSLDIGARHWGYLPALCAFRPGPWTGVEIDGHQRYVNGTTRAARGRAMAAACGDADYRIGCVSEETGLYGLVTWLHPFVTPGPLEAAGLPGRFLRPSALLRHAWARVAPGGALWLINDNEEEDVVQGELFRELEIPAHRLGPLESPFPGYETPRFGWIATRERSSEEPPVP